MAAAAQANSAATRTLFGEDYGQAASDAALSALITSYKRKAEYSSVETLPASLEAAANPTKRPKKTPGSSNALVLSQKQHGTTHSPAGQTKSLIQRPNMTQPRPEWHAPWKLMRVISGHIGWVRALAVEPNNQWFASGAGDRTIKIWDLASGSLRLTLTGHISAVRGLAVSPRHPIPFLLWRR